MKIKRLNESFELVKPEEEIIDTVEVVEETLTEASANPWDKLVKAFPELTIADNNDAVTESTDTVEDTTEQIVEGKGPYDKLVDAYPELEESVSNDEEDSIREKIRAYLAEHPYPSTMDAEDIAEEVAENLFDIEYHNADPDISYAIFSEVEHYLDNADTEDSWDEYDDQYEFDNEDDVVEQDRMHAALYGGDREYCDKCGSKLVMDEWGGTCPKCNAEEVFDAKYDDDVSSFDDESIDEAKEKVSSHAKKILSPLTRNEAIVKAQSLLKSNPDCDGVCYGIEKDFFEPYCITAEEAERIGAGKQMVYVLWNRNK